MCPAPATAPQRPRILLAITKADVGGAQMHVLQIVRELGGQYEFEIITGAEDFLTRQMRELGVTVHIVDELVRPIRPTKDLRACRSVYRLIRQRRPALVHAHSFKAGIVARLAARIARVPCLFTAHGWAFTPGAPPAQRLIGLVVESLLCRLCQGVVTISRHDYQLASRWHVGLRSSRHLVLNAADRAPRRADLTAEPPGLLTIGRLTPVKNQEFLLRVLAQLPGEARLEIIGEGPERERLDRLAEELDVSGRVTFKGEVTAIGDPLARAGIFILGSHFEGLPLSILEAMSAGLPVVSTDVGGVSEAVTDDETGLLISAGDVTAFATAVNRLLTDSALRRRMGEQGFRRYTAQFQVARFIDEMAGVYQGLLLVKLTERVAGST